MSRAFANFQLSQGKVTVHRNGARLRVIVEGPVLERILIDIDRGDLVIPASGEEGERA